MPWTVLADPEGNVFCVLASRAIYADTGPTATVVVSCADPRAMALFWNAAMDWALHEVTDDFARLRSAAGVGPYLEFVRVRDFTAWTHVHLDLRPYFRDDQAAEIPCCELWARSMLTLGRATCRGWCSLTPRVTISVFSRRADAADRLRQAHRRAADVRSALAKSSSGCY